MGVCTGFSDFTESIPSCDMSDKIVYYDLIFKCFIIFFTFSPFSISLINMPIQSHQLIFVLIFFRH